MLKLGEKKPERISLLCKFLNIFDVPNRVNLNIFMDGYKYSSFKIVKLYALQKFANAVCLSQGWLKKTKAQFHLFISGDRRIQKYREM